MTEDLTFFYIQHPVPIGSSQQPAAFAASCSEAAAVASVAVAVFFLFVFSSRRYLSFKEYIEK